MNPPRCPECQELASQWAVEVFGLDSSRVVAPDDEDRSDAAIFGCGHGHRWGSQDDWDRHLAALGELADLLEVAPEVLGDLLPAPLTSRQPFSPDSLWDEPPDEALEPTKHWFEAGSPVLVLVGIAGDREVEVALPKVTWLGHFPCLGAEPGSRYPSSRHGDLMDWMRQKVEQVVDRRLALFRTCTECAGVMPPEWMHNRSYCQGCAQRNHGVIY